jgi:hypothetical protein
MDWNKKQQLKTTLITLIWCAFSPTSIMVSEAAEISFARDVLPILSDKCFYCHGPDPSHREADLRLDRKEEAFAIKEGQAAILPGNPEESLLIRRIRTLDPDDLMPPPDSNKALTKQEIKTLEEWIASGADWGRHWAFEPPVRPSLPSKAEHPIDAFIEHRLQHEGRTLASPTPRHTLLRRLSFDLTGLPPSLMEVETFEQDSSPNAIEDQIDRLLNSPHYGERMAMWWLDAARYADTDGYQQDATRSNWPWRDWVIEAFNTNMPFDQFTIEQFAGDLLPNATPEQILATSFHRHHMTNGEGGRDPEESRIDYVIDRVNTVGTLWMGMTVNCSQCHSHKFDPLSQEEYYQLNAFFNNIDEDGRAGSAAKPYLDYQSPNINPHLDAAERQLKQAQLRLDQVILRAAPTFNTWLESRKQEVSTGFKAWHALQPSSIQSAEGTAFSIQRESILVAQGPNPRQDDYQIVAKPDLERITGIRLEVFSDSNASNGRYGRGQSGEFILTNIKLFVRKTGASLMHEIALDNAIADFEAKPEGGERYGKIKDTLDDDPRNGWTTHGDDLPPKHIAVFALKEPLVMEADEEIIFVMMHRSTLGDANTGKFRVSVSNQPGQAVRSLDPMPLEALAKAQLQEPKTIGEDLRARLKQQFLIDHLPYQQEKPRYDQVRSYYDEIKNAAKPQKVMVLDDREEPRETHILVRGVWDQKGKTVRPGLPVALGGAANPNPTTRLDLAKWLVSGKHPLTARVIVNHLWQLMFGAGLVRTPDDFGLQGEHPTHPDLLDWLAVELVDSGWDIKHMLRLMVTSRAYQQSSHVDQEWLDKDPYNKLLGRSPRHRLPSWMLHDAVLKTGGLLNPIQGGPPVKPYQPSGIWQDIFMGRFTYVPSPGTARYRRMVYAFWRRSSAPAFLFDQAQRRVCEVGVRRTNTPLHALTLLNDETVLEASQSLAADCLRTSPTPQEALRTMGHRILSRSFSWAEWDIIQKKWQDTHAHYRSNPEEARALLTIGQQTPHPSLDVVQHASLMWMANMIFNLDEAMTHE